MSQFLSDFKKQLPHFKAQREKNTNLLRKDSQYIYLSNKDASYLIDLFFSELNEEIKRKEFENIHEKILYLIHPLFYREKINLKKEHLETLEILFTHSQFKKSSLYDADMYMMSKMFNFNLNLEFCNLRSKESFICYEMINILDGGFDRAIYFDNDMIKNTSHPNFKYNLFTLIDALDNCLILYSIDSIEQIYKKISTMYPKSMLIFNMFFQKNGISIKNEKIFARDLNDFIESYYPYEDEKINTFFADYILQNHYFLSSIKGFKETNKKLNLMIDRVTKYNIEKKYFSHYDTVSKKIQDFFNGPKFSEEMILKNLKIKEEIIIHNERKVKKL